MHAAIVDLHRVLQKRVDHLADGGRSVWRNEIEVISRDTNCDSQRPRVRLSSGEPHTYVPGRRCLWSEMGSRPIPRDLNLQKQAIHLLQDTRKNSNAHPVLRSQQRSRNFQQTSRCSTLSQGTRTVLLEGSTSAASSPDSRIIA